MRAKLSGVGPCDIRRRLPYVVSDSGFSGFGVGHAQVTRGDLKLQGCLAH